MSGFLSTRPSAGEVDSGGGNRKDGSFNFGIDNFGKLNFGSDGRGTLGILTFGMLNFGNQPRRGAPPASAVEESPLRELLLCRCSSRRRVFSAFAATFSAARSAALAAFSTFRYSGASSLIVGFLTSRPSHDLLDAGCGACSPAAFCLPKLAPEELVEPEAATRFAVDWDDDCDDDCDAFCD